MGHRYSPGYGDYSIEVQKVILDRTQAQKHLGIHLSDSFLMIPTKSITAVAGIYSDVSATSQIRNRQNYCAGCKQLYSCRYLQQGRTCRG